MADGWMGWVGWGWSGKMIFGKPIFVALAQRREARRQQLEQQFAHGSMAGIMPGGMPAQQMAQAGVVAAGVRPGQMMPAAMSQVLPGGIPHSASWQARPLPAVKSKSNVKNRNPKFKSQANTPSPLSDVRS